MMGTMGAPYVVEAHGMFLGEVPVRGLLGALFPELKTDGWVRDLKDATLYQDGWEAEKVVSRHYPCASLRSVKLVLQ